MTTKSTRGIRVEHESFYQHDYSHPLLNEFMFAYRVEITNESDKSIQVLSRCWEIVDGDGSHRTVEGEGLVGAQPIIGPGESYQYVSGCNLHCDIGMQYGYYVCNDGYEIFEVEIPRIYHQAPQKGN